MKSWRILALLLLALAPARAAHAQLTVLYDYANRTQGSQIFAYDGQSATQVPANTTTPNTVLTATEYNGIETDNGVFHTFATTTSGNYALTRFEIVIDEPEATVTSLDALWNGRGVNASGARADGARLYIWNYATSAYELLQASANTDTEVTLTGTRSASLVNFIGGAGQDTVLLLAVSADTRNGGSASDLRTDYVRLNVSSTLCASTFRDEFSTVSYSGNDGTLFWGGPFTEVDSGGGGAAGGLIRVTGGRLSLNNSGNTLPNVQRPADASGASRSTLSFDLVTSSGVDNSDAVVVEVSSNGGGVWTTLETFTGISGATTGSRSYDVLAFSTANFRVRYRITNGYTNSNESFQVDNLQVLIHATCRPHFAISNDGAGNSCTAEPVVIARHTGPHVIDTAYTGTATLATSTGNGTWSLVAGSGTLTNLGGGAATYAFAAADAGDVTLGLANAVGETLSIDVTAGAVRESPAEDPDLTFSNLATTTVRDEFSTVAYNRNDGSASWSGNWIERDDNGNPATGNVAILAGELSLEDFPNTDGDPSLERQVDLSGATTATFSFDFRTTSEVDANDNVFIEISTNAGSSWTILEELDGIDGAISASRSYDITAFRTANTRVRFRIDGLNGTGGTSCCYGDANEQFIVDDVQIAYTMPAICSADHFTISHDGAGIHCLTEPIVVTAKDAANSTLVTYNRPITLDTQSGQGTWSLLSGDGTFLDATAGDGRATYTFVASDAGDATFALSYTQGTPTLDVDAFETALTTRRDDDTEGTLVFAASGFTVTASALANPPPNPINDPIANRTAGTTATLHIAAFGTTPTDPQCGVIESYTGAKTLRFWTTYVDPTTAAPAPNARVPTIGATSIGGSEAGAVAIGVTFTNGQASVGAKYKDVGRIQIEMKDTGSGGPAGGIRGATNPFVWRPADLVITQVLRASDNFANPGASTPTGTVFVGAGRAFGVKVQVRDAEGSLTPNYGRESASEGLRITASTLVAPAGGRNGSANNGAIGNATTFGTLNETGGATAAGEFYGSSFSWDEVGAIRLRATVADASYLGTGDVTGTESGTVGRFTPASFVLALNTPRFVAGCSTGSFTYLGAPFAYEAASVPRIGVTATALAGTTTRNYSGSWFRITNASLTSANASTIPPTTPYTTASGTLDLAGLPAIDPVITDTGNGTGTLVFGSGTGLRFVRGALVAPFDAEISLAQAVADLDGVAVSANPARFGQATAGNGIAFTTAKTVRFGRVAIANAHGSELTSLPMTLRAEYWNGIGFIASTADGCTAIAAANLVLTPSPAGLVTTPTITNNPLSVGNAGLVLSAPGAGNRGTVDVRPNLGSGGALVPWLRYDWPADGLDGVYDDDPVGRATFGIFAGDDPTIFRREVY
jgi:hypothetical protein